MPKGNAETVKSSKSKYDLDPKSIEVHLRSWSLHVMMCEVSSLYAKRKWNYHAETVKSLKSITSRDLWPFDPKISVVMVNTCVKDHRCSSKGKGVVQKVLKVWVPNLTLTFDNSKGVIVQKKHFHRQTDRQPWWNQYTPTTSLAGVNKDPTLTHIMDSFHLLD